MVDEGLLSAEALEHALAEQQRTSRPLGELLVELGYVSPGAVANALAEQHGGLLKTEYGISFGLQRPPGGAAPVADTPPEPAAGLRVVRADGEPQPEPPLQAQPVPEPPTVAPEAPWSPRAGPTPVQAADATSDRVSELEAELALREAKLANVVGQATARLGDARAQLEAATAERETLAARVGELEAQLASVPPETAPDPEAEAELARLREAHAGLDAQVRALHAERESLAARVHELEAQLAAMPTEPVTVPDPEAEAELARLRDAHAALDAQVHQLHAEREGLTMRVQELEAHLASVPAEPQTVPDPETEAELARLRDAYGRSKQSSRRLARPQRSPIRSFRPSSSGSRRKASSCVPRSPRPAVPPAVPPRQPQSCRRRRCSATRWRPGSQRSATRWPRRSASWRRSPSRSPRSRPRRPRRARRSRGRARPDGERAAGGACLAGRARGGARRRRRAAEAAVVAAPEPIPSLQPELDRLRAEVARAENRLGRAETEAEYYRATLGQRDDELAEASVVSRRAGERTAALQAELENLQSRLTDTEQRLVAATLDLARIEAEEQHVRTEAGRVGGLAAELATLRDELDRKDVELAAATLLTEHANERSGELETDVAELRRELTDRDSRLAQATAEAAWLEQELEAKIAAEAIDEDSHQLFVPSAGGYSLLDRDGTAPDVGDFVELEDGRFVVAKRARSPLPGVRSLCAYLARV